ncbi:uncharacterized protein LOC125942591 [Dermacentor silvarum]|uniref:uncharacterized protein LOC125942591 n=1 Tax=Dermacentor silvarum TaxID=543639 RepID=UPI002100E1B6|nr:uncharacterized protein LOC125942591 [Dermacentor silvarum]
MVSAHEVSSARGPPCTVPSDIQVDPSEVTAQDNTSETIYIADDYEWLQQTRRPCIVSVFNAEEGVPRETERHCDWFTGFLSTARPGDCVLLDQGPLCCRVRPILKPSSAHLDPARAFRSDWPFLSIVALIAMAMVIFLLVVYLKEDNGVGELVPKLAMRMLEREGLLYSRD